MDQALITFCFFSEQKKGMQYHTMRPERLIYTYVSFASNIEANWGHGTPVEGVERTAKLVRGHGIPVTWNVNSGSVKVLKERINRWHEQYGDAVILGIGSLVEKYKSKDQLKQVVAMEWDALKEAFPWAETRVAASGLISNTLIEVLEELDFKGLWGYCWEQTWWDGITHKGIPWGFWYISSGNYKAPHPLSGRITACEWTARDLHLSYHTGSPCIYSTDPNDVLRAGLCTGDNIEYWKKLFNDYINNTDSNEYVYFTQQQESHEMEHTDSFAVWPLQDIEASAKMLDNFFNYIKGFGITITTLPEAIEHYQQRNRNTAPNYMLTTDSDIRPEINGYNMALGGVGMGPWPETFLYYDAQCQMAFINGECRPRMLRNYTASHKSEKVVEETIPMVFVNQFEENQDRITIEFKIAHHKAMPFGLTYWDNLAIYEIEACPDVIEAKMIDVRLIFIRFDLAEGERLVKLTLRKK